MAQLDFRANLNVAGEQAKRRRMRQRLQVTDELAHPATHLAAVLLKDVVEPENVMLKKFAEMFRRGGDIVDAEKFADEADIGAPGKLHLLRSVMEVELLGKSLRERRRARAARVNERAVDVEENKPNHAARKLIALARSGNAHRCHRFWL